MCKSELVGLLEPNGGWSIEPLNGWLTTSGQDKVPTPWPCISNNGWFSSLLFTHTLPSRPAGPTWISPMHQGQSLLGLPWLAFLLYVSSWTPLLPHWSSLKKGCKCHFLPGVFGIPSSSGVWVTLPLPLTASWFWSLIFGFPFQGRLQILRVCGRAFISPPYYLRGSSS